MIIMHMKYEHPVDTCPCCAADARVSETVGDEAVIIDISSNAIKKSCKNGIWNKVQA